jgi:ABC-type Fe3+-siderophore transport system permease subunit
MIAGEREGSITTLLLSGIAISSFFSALVSLMLYVSNER